MHVADGACFCYTEQAKEEEALRRQRGRRVLLHAGYVLALRPRFQPELRCLSVHVSPTSQAGLLLKAIPAGYQCPGRVVLCCCQTQSLILLCIRARGRSDAWSHLGWLEGGRRGKGAEGKGI